MTGTSSSDEDAERARRRRGWLIGLAVLGIPLIIQSVTITLPIRGRILDETSSRPVPHAAVTALWQFDVLTPHNVASGGTARFAETLTDDDGTFRIPMAFIVHMPLLPFSLQTRSDSNMPRIIVVAKDYFPYDAGNDVYGIHGPSHTAGALFLRTSSLEGQDHYLTPLEVGRARGWTYDLSATSSALQQAAGACWMGHRCAKDRLPKTWNALLSSGLRVPKDSNRQ